jgi:hypothetical protein
VLELEVFNSDGLAILSLSVSKSGDDVSLSALSDQSEKSGDLLSEDLNYDNLNLNLNKLESLFRMLKNGFENGIDKIKEYCFEQIRLIQLSTENRIEQINKINDELIETIREYERKCIQYFLDKNDQIKNSLDKLIGDAAIFVRDKQEYLNQFKIEYSFCFYAYL